MELTGRLDRQNAGQNVLVLELREDRLDASNVREFKDAVQSMTQEAAQVVLDLSGVKFVDSSGMGTLIACLRQLNARKGDLRLSCMSSTVRALFELMRMHRVFSIHDTRDAAVRSYA